MPKKQSAEITKKWLYKEDCPQGQLFDLTEVDEHELEDQGWIGTPAKFKNSAPVVIDKKIAETLSITDFIAKVKEAGFRVLTKIELEAEINKAVSEDREAIAKVAEDKAAASELAKFQNYEKTFFESPKDLTKPELIEYALKRSGGELRLSSTLKEQTMIDRIAEWIEKAKG